MPDDSQQDYDESQNATESPLYSAPDPERDRRYAIADAERDIARRRRRLADPTTRASALPGLRKRLRAAELLRRELLATDRPISIRSRAQGPYDEFNVEFQRQYGRPITQNELNQNKTLVNTLGISNELFRLLPLDRQMSFDAKRLALLSNDDLIPLFQFNPHVISGFDTKRLTSFPNEIIQSTILPHLDKALPNEAANVRNYLRTAIQPPAAAQPGASPSRAQPDGQPLAGGLGIPRLSEPQLPGDILDRSPLSVFYGTQGLEPGGFGQRTQREDVYGALPQRARYNVLNGRSVYPELAAAGGPRGIRYRLASEPDANPFDEPFDEPVPEAGPEAANPFGEAPSGGGRSGGRGRVQFPSEGALEEAQAEKYLADAARQRELADEARAQLDFERERAHMENARQLEMQARELGFRGIELDRQMQQRAAELASQERIAGQRADVERATARGFFEGGLPTLEREVAIAESGRRNAEILARRAEIAGNFREAELQRQQADKHFQRAQTLQEEIQRGNLGLAGRAQTEVETAGAFGRGLESARFQRETLESPGGYLGGIYATRGESLRPFSPPRAEFSVFGRPRPQGGEFAPTRAPLSYEDIAGSPQTPAGVRYGLGADELPQFQARFPVASAQRLAHLLPSERQAYGAGVRALGYNPEDVFEQSRRLSELPTPPATRQRVSYAPNRARIA